MNLEKIGFKVRSENRSPYNGELTDFYKEIDNGHIVSGHDTTEVFVTNDDSHVIIEIDHHSSYDYHGKRLVFRGRCDDIEFFEKILNAVLKY